VLRVFWLVKREQESLASGSRDREMPYEQLADAIHQNDNNEYFFFSYSFRVLIKLKEEFAKPADS
jgi:hypothetical protein